MGERLRPVLAWGVFALVCVLITAGGGVLNAAIALVQLAAPAQPTGDRLFTRATDYIIEILFAASLLAAAAAAALIGRYARHAPRWGAFGTAAAAAYAFGPALFAVSSAATAARGRESLDFLQLPAIGIWLIAGLLMAVAVIRGRLLPVVIGLAFAAGLPASMGAGERRAAGPGRAVDRGCHRAGPQAGPGR